MENADHFSLVRECDEADPLVAQWIKIGLLPTMSAMGAEVWASSTQYERLRRLTSSEFEWELGPQLPDDLFPPAIVTALGWRSCLTEGAGVVQSAVESLWMQLLPLWVDAMQLPFNCQLQRTWHELDLNGYRMYSLDAMLVERSHRSRQRHQQFSLSRSSLFARSANYMGSKTALAGQLLDIVDAVESVDTTVVDLMCGSGAMAGAFARHYSTVASDAQDFCRLLGLVQGGGMTRRRAEMLAEQVIQEARARYGTLAAEQRQRIEEEDQLLNSELTPSVLEAVVARLQSRAVAWEQEHLGGANAVEEAWKRGNLLSHLYAGIYFGDRQTAELDCLRQAVAMLPDEGDRQWALGALVCAASACAHTYGGHFAQPKLDVTADGKRRGDISEALQQRSLSVTHEFFVRLTSLADESERVQHAVDVVAGPWPVALQAVAARKAIGPVCVYVDPPYTRDEYSRYYHVLEEIVRYQPQSVSGKGRLPQRGSPGRFASSFNARRPEVIERQIANVLHACLTNGWNCLWSYSNTGTASITGTLDHLKDVAFSAEVFQMAHTYKAQGKRNAKQVLEYAVHLRPKSTRDV